jgi:hypothetical protein
MLDASWPFRAREGERCRHGRRITPLPAALARRQAHRAAAGAGAGGLRGPQSKRGWGGGGAGIGGRVLPTSSRLRARFKGAYNFRVPWGERPSLACAASGCDNPIHAAASSSMASGTACSSTCRTISRVDPGRLQGPGSTRLRVASSVTKDHVRELKMRRPPSSNSYLK